jgi:phosphotransferase system HPr (HPr) family protein
VVTKQIVIKNPTGLHARPAVRLVNLSKGFKSAISLQSGDRTCDPKSIFTVLHCNIRIGETVTITAEGTDEEEAIQKLLDFIGALEE